MKIKLLDWNAKATWVEIPDDTAYISGVILSGDMVMEYPVRADASVYRLHDFYDGYWKIDRKDFDKFNQLTDSYDVFELMEHENEQPSQE